MSENPYTTPEAAPSINVSPENDLNLVNVAKLQRWLNLAILGYFGIIVLAVVSPESNEILMMLVGFLMIGVGIFSLIIVIRLASTMYGTLSAILHGIGMFIPLLGLLVLLIINSRATRLLKKGGYSVGLLGAKNI